MLVRFRQDVINIKPKMVVILSGTNDIAGNTGHITNENIENNYQTLFELAKMHGIRVVVESILPVHDAGDTELYLQRSSERIRALNLWLFDYCIQNDIKWIDYDSSMIDDFGQLKKELSDDGVHPNAHGYEVMTKLVKSVLGV